MSLIARTGELEPNEAARLAELEAVVQAGLQTFVEVGLALQAIRDERLYRQTHTTFETYLDERWGMGRAHGYRLIDAAQVAELVSPIGDIANEAQARELVPLLEDEVAAVEVWRELKAEHGDKVTAAKVRTAVQQRLAFGEIGDTWPGSSHARLLRDSLRKGEAANGTPLDRTNTTDRHIWSAIYWSMRGSEADYKAATLTWEMGQKLLATSEPEKYVAELDADDSRKRADGAVRIARRFPTRMSLQLAMDALEDDPGFVSWQLLARWP